MHTVAVVSDVDLLFLPCLLLLPPLQDLAINILLTLLIWIPGTVQLKELHTCSINCFLKAVCMSWAARPVAGLPPSVLPLCCDDASFRFALTCMSERTCLP